MTTTEIKYTTDSDRQAPFNIRDFAGIWTEAEADKIRNIIRQCCEQINPEDWK